MRMRAAAGAAPRRAMRRCSGACASARAAGEPRCTSRASLPSLRPLPVRTSTPSSPASASRRSWVLPTHWPPRSIHACLPPGGPACTRWRRPPTRPCASSTSTRSPRARSVRAADRPLMPPPTISTSYCGLGLSRTAARGSWSAAGVRSACATGGARSDAQIASSAASAQPALAGRRLGKDRAESLLLIATACNRAYRGAWARPGEGVMVGNCGVVEVCDVR